MSMIPSILNTANQAAVFTVNAFSIGFRGLRIYQTYHDPDISSTNRWASIALNSASIAAQTASCSSSFEEKQIEQLTAISNATSLGADIIYVMGDENASTTNKVLLIAKFLSATNQAHGGRKELSDFVHIAEAVAFCYENRNRIGEQIQTLKNKRKCTRRTASTLDDKEKYQKLLSNCREKYSGKTDLSILLFARECIAHQESERECNQTECEKIIRGAKITDLKKIPYMLKDEFQDRICEMSEQPIHTLVSIRESADSKPLYYDWSNLAKAVEKKEVPKNWPITVPFSPAAIVVDHLGTQNIEDRLKKAALKPNIVERAQAVLKRLAKRKESLEAMKALSLEDIIGCKVDEGCMKLIDEKILNNKILNIEELRRNECSQ